MSSDDYAFVLKFQMDEPLPALSDMEGFVPGFVDNFFGRRVTRVTPDCTEIWVRVNPPEHRDSDEALTAMKERLDTPKEDLAYFRSTLPSISSDDVSIAHMPSSEYLDATEHSASIARKEMDAPAR